jgi:hypothetical protein
MNPIAIHIHGNTTQTPAEICTQLLDLERWPEFQGYSILPGIQSAHFEVKTPNMLGSRIAVQNTDGSAHIEEIITWDVDRQVALKFQNFSAPLNNLASHFIETWTFTPTDRGTDIIRAMSMYPKNILGWLMLLPISQMMKKAFEKQAQTMSK